MSTGPRARYAIAAVRERVREHDGPVMDFAVGRLEDRPPAAVEEMLASGVGLVEGGHAEIDAFAEDAAAMLARVYDLEVAADDIMPVPGGRSAISFMAAALVRPGHRVVVTEPAYPAFVRLADQLEGEVVSLELDPTDGFAPDLSGLSDDDARKVRLVSLNSPNNPTGAVLESGALNEMLARLQPGTVVFNDDTYGPLIFDRPPWSLLKEADGSADGLRLLELHSLAKIFALGPVPVAFLAGHRELIGELRELSEFAWTDQNALFLRVARHCLGNDDRLEQVRQDYRRRIADLTAALEALGFRYHQPEAGMYVFCDAPASIAGRAVASASEAADALLALHGLAVVPWDVEPRAYLRFSARYGARDLEALRKLAEGGPVAGY